MPHRTRLATRVAAGVLAGAVVATPVSAHARTYVHPDARGDMVEMSVYPRDPKPDETKGDILRIRVRHTARRIQVRVVFADLVQSPDILYLTGVVFRSNKVRRVVQIESRPQNWRGTAVMYAGKQYAYPVRCAIHRSHDFVHNVAVFGFPRSCMHNPRWIRVRIQVTTAVPLDETVGVPPVLEDDAFRTSIGPDIPSPLSPRIRRG